MGGPKNRRGIQTTAVLNLVHKNKKIIIIKKIKKEVREEIFFKAELSWRGNIIVLSSLGWFNTGRRHCLSRFVLFNLLVDDLKV